MLYFSCYFYKENNDLPADGVEGVAVLVVDVGAAVFLLGVPVELELGEAQGLGRGSVFSRPC